MFQPELQGLERKIDSKTFSHATSGVQGIKHMNKN